MPRITFEEALLTLEGKGPVLDVAREVSAILRESGVEGAVIGGVAVGLHGYLRTTDDVDVMVLADMKRLGEELVKRGYAFEPTQKQFVKNGVPVHLVTREHFKDAPKTIVEIDGIRTISLNDLISMKLRSGTTSIVRAKDLGDAIGLIQHHRLTKNNAGQIDADLRGEFRKLIDAIERERGE